MKARLILNKNQRLMLLCEDGTIEKVTDNLLFNFLTRFNREDAFFSNGSQGFWKTEYCPDMTMYPGETVAFIADNKTLIIQDFKPFMPLVEYVEDFKEYISVPEFAARNDKSVEMVKVYCREGRIPGAKKVARNWLIPSDAEYPVEKSRQREGRRGPRPNMRKKNRQDSDKER